MYRILPFILTLFLTLQTAFAAESDHAIARREKRQVNLSTGGSSTSESSGTTQSAPASNTANDDSTTTVVASATVTSQGSVVVVSSTLVVNPTSTGAVSVTAVTSTLTQTNAQGSPTRTVTGTSESSTTVAVSASYTSYKTSVTQAVTQTYTSVVGGSTVTGTRTTSSVVPITTSEAVSPSALAANGKSGSSGLSDSSKKIIGGVVGGIGGALLIGGLAFTAWRIWGKKKNLHDDDLYDPNAHQEKGANSAENTPFRSTLDQYHNPGPVNTASNF